MLPHNQQKRDWFTQLSIVLELKDLLDKGQMH